MPRAAGCQHRPSHPHSLVLVASAMRCPPHVRRWQVVATLVLRLLLHRGTTQETSSWCRVSAACRALALQKQQGPSWSSASALQPSAEPVPCPSRGTKPPRCWGLLGWWQELLMFLWTMTTSWDPGSDFHFCSAGYPQPGTRERPGWCSWVSPGHMPPLDLWCLGKGEVSVKAPQA